MLNFERFSGLAAAALLALPLAAGSVAALPLNGSFEDTNHNNLTIVTTKNTAGRTQSSLTSGTGNNNWGVFTALPGWTTTGAGVELQTANTLAGINAKDGLFYAELDSDNATSSGTNSGISQAFSLAAGQYEFSFWYASRTNTVSTNGIRYSLVDGISLIDDVTGTGGDALTWRKISRIFTLNADDDLTLSFLAIGTDDTFGGFIDDIRINEIPLPAAAWLLLAGLGGMGIIARRRKAA